MERYIALCCTTPADTYIIVQLGTHVSIRGVLVVL